MHSIIPYLLAAGAGVLIAHFISRSPDLRSMRLSQLIFVPVGMMLALYFMGGGQSSGGAGVGDFVSFLLVLGFLILLLAPNIAHLFGAGLSGLLDPHDWTSSEEEIALRPIRHLIDKDQYSEALADLDELLKKHKPTYEALLLKAKLLHHFGSVDETTATLLSLIRLSQSTAQQLAVMELLAGLEELLPAAPGPLATSTRRLEIHHELVLFEMTSDPSPPHKVIPPGVHEIHETLHRGHRWFKLVKEDWGNAAACWEAVLTGHIPPAVAPKEGILWWIVRLHESISSALKGKSRRQRQAEAKNLFHEATQFIRRDDWKSALPLLQRASASDPDHYEIAFRWVQAVRRTADDTATREAVRQVLEQSRWTEHEEQMLRQLQHIAVK